MKTLDPLTAAREAIAATNARPATAVLFDAPDVRLVVFRLEPGQSVAPHRSASTVMLTVLAGEGLLSGANDERHCVAGDFVVYAPSETHGMAAHDHQLFLLATITPRPGERTAAIAPLRAAV